MKRYYITIIGYHQNSNTTNQTIIDCDGMSISGAGCYEFWVQKDKKTYEALAYYPIRQTIITKIEQLKSMEKADT
jgi:hypothetical protein